MQYSSNVLVPKILFLKKFVDFLSGLVFINIGSLVSYVNDYSDVFSCFITIFSSIHFKSLSTIKQILFFKYNRNIYTATVLTIVPSYFVSLLFELKCFLTNYYKLLLLKILSKERLNANNLNNVLVSNS